MHGSHGGVSGAHSLVRKMIIDFRHFPGLQAEGFAETSSPTTDYNCIAWAAGDQTQWWWPHPDAF